MLRRKRESVAPVLIDGTTGVPGQNSAVSFSIGPTTSERSGEGGLAAGTLTRVTVMAGLPRALTMDCWTSSNDSPGSTRQFTVAVAVCGSAFVACPPSRRVATQVVRMMEL